MKIQITSLPKQNPVTMKVTATTKTKTIRVQQGVIKRCTTKSWNFVKKDWIKKMCWPIFKKILMNSKKVTKDFPVGNERLGKI